MTVPVCRADSITLSLTGDPCFGVLEGYVPRAATDAEPVRDMPA
jgi:hypothetical protein